MAGSELSRRELLSGSAYVTIGVGTAALMPNASSGRGCGAVWRFDP